MKARYGEKKTVTIRRFEPRDLGGVLEVDAEVGGDHDPVLFTVFYESHPSTLLVAESEGQIIGVVVGVQAVSIRGAGVLAGGETRSSWPGDRVQADNRSDGDIPEVGGD
jgi:hypothetical protein